VAHSGAVMAAVLELVSLGLVVLAATSAPGCVEGRCTQDRECPVGQFCEVATGVCRIPECARHEDCDAGLVCSSHACVAGCRGDGECARDERCLGLRCTPVGGVCDCALAPTFCATDLNPRSATAGQTLCLDDQPATVLVFGNVGCSHCQALLAEVLDLGASVGTAPPVVFVQLPTLPVDAATVGIQFAGYTVPVVLDTVALNLTGGFAADWYYVMLVDANGCLAGHWGPLEAIEVRGPTGAEIGAAWSLALSGGCPLAATQ